MCINYLLCVKYWSCSYLKTVTVIIWLFCISRLSVVVEALRIRRDYSLVIQVERDLLREQKEKTLFI